MIEIDSRRVETLSGLGIPKADIAHLLRIPAEELSRQFGNELRDGPIKANSRVAEELYRKATGEGPQSVTAAVFWMKARAGWGETTRQELGGLDGGPLIIQRIIVSPDGSRSALNPVRPNDPAPREMITGVPGRIADG